MINELKEILESNPSIKIKGKKLAIGPLNKKTGEYKVNFGKETWFVDSEAAGSTPEKYWDTNIEKELIKLIGSIVEAKSTKEEREDRHKEVIKASKIFSKQILSIIKKGTPNSIEFNGHKFNFDAFSPKGGYTGYSAGPFSYNIIYKEAKNQGLENLKGLLSSASKLLDLK